MKENKTIAIIMAIILLGALGYGYTAAQYYGTLWYPGASGLQPVEDWVIYSPNDITFMDEIRPDGDVCANTEILQKTGADDWDCVTIGGAGGATRALDNLSAVAINTSLISDGNKVDNLGSPTNQWGEVYIDDLHFDSGGEICGWGAQMAVDKNWLPKNTDTHDLGSQTYIWAEGHITKLYLDADSTIEAADVDAWLTAVIEDNLAASLVFDDGDLLDFGTFVTGATEGIMLPAHATDCSTATAEGQICWEEDDKNLYVGDGAAAIQINTAGGDVTDVWDCASGDCNTMTMAGGESLDASAGDIILPALSVDAGTYAADSIDHADILDTDQMDTKCIWFEDPTADDDFVSIWRNGTANAFLITEIWGESDQTVNFDLVESAGDCGDPVIPAAGEDENTGLSCTISADEEIDLKVNSVTNTPTWVSICWTGNWVD